MKPPSDRQLMRLLHGELAAHEQAALERQIGRDPDLAERYRDLAQIWRRLEVPDETQLEDPALAGKVLERAGRESASKTPSWKQLAPIWRAATLLATAAGILAGVMLTPSRRQVTESEAFAAMPSLAASYLAAFEEALEDMDEDRESDTEVER